MDKKVQRNFLWIALLVLGTIGILARHNRTAPYQTSSGLIFGTVYNITYQYDGDLKAEIETSSNDLTVRCRHSMTQLPLLVSTGTKILFPTHSLSTYSTAVWKYPRRPKELLTSQ